MHITLTGNLGSGKSTVCGLLEAQYGYEIFSTGKVIRRIADELGISVLEMNELMTKDHKYDKMIDDTTARISRENPEKSILFDSRLAWNFVDRSFKVFLSVDLMEAARRVYQDKSRGEVEAYKSVEDAAEQLRARANNEDKRYEELYGIHYFDFNNYNLVLDSSFAPPELVAAVLLHEVKKAEASCEEPRTGCVLISPKRLGYVTETPIREEAPYYPEEAITIVPEGDGFRVTSGEALVRAAAEQGLPYVLAYVG